MIGSRFPDTLTGSQANNILDGRTSNDTLSGLGGNDTFPEGEFATGADDFSGGEGRDAVSTAPRRAGITVDLDNVADDGAAGEGDNVRGDVEIVTSGTGSDVLIGNAAANKFESSGGTDRIEGRGGADSLFAVDDLAGFRRPDTVLGGAGNDRIDVVDDAADDVRCGAGAADSAFIDAGLDTIVALRAGGHPVNPQRGRHRSRMHPRGASAPAQHGADTPLPLARHQEAPWSRAESEEPWPIPDPDALRPTVTCAGAYPGGPAAGRALRRSAPGVTSSRVVYGSR